MTLRTLDELDDIAGRTVFLRLDLNTPLDAGRVADDTRIRASLPTISELRGRQAALVIASHLGRPNGKVEPSLSLRPVAERLSELVGDTVAMLDPIPDALPGGPDSLFLLENLRFDPREQANDVSFAGDLASVVDGYVDDAFGAVHRAHASVAALPELMLASGRRAVAGRLVQREVEVLTRLLHDPVRPYAAVLGGAKVSDKLPVIASLIERVDSLLIGGAMAFTLIAAEGGEVGASLVEEDRIAEARSMLDSARERGVEVLLPVDVVAAGSVSAEAETFGVDAARIPEGLIGLDIGPRTVAAFTSALADAKTIFWNGPMGVFELGPFAEGTHRIASSIAGSSAFTVVGGGDSLLAVKQGGLADRFDHLSTGGGASLEFLEGKPLPGLAVLSEGSATR
jgi:phosphoglycerate kinase